MTTATPTRPTPKAMPSRRPERPAVQTTQSSGTTWKPQERTFRRNPGELTSTIGTALALRPDCAVSPELLYRPACNNACERVQAYAEEVPTGKSNRRWQSKTTKMVNSQMEIWFGLEPEGKQPNFLPNIRKVARQIFVSACLEFAIKGAPGQQAEWYQEMVNKMDQQPPKEKKEKPKTEATSKTTDDHKPSTVQPPASTKSSLEERFTEAKKFLCRYGEKKITRGDKQCQNWSPTTIAKAVELLRAYFFNTSYEVLEKSLSDKVLAAVRQKFAFACIRRGLLNLPGQQAKWYQEVKTATQTYIESRHSA